MGARVWADRPPGARVLQPFPAGCSRRFATFGDVAFPPSRLVPVACAAATIAFGGCLLPQTELLSQGPGTAAPDAGDGGGPQDSGDAAAPASSCKALKLTSPATPDGVQTIDPDGSGPIAPFQAWCDMTRDGGGWMLVTEPMIDGETGALATAVRSVGPNGGLVLRVYLNEQGCSNVPKTRHRVFFDDRTKWSQIRFKQTFAGDASCWHIWGALEPTGLDSNLNVFDGTIDTVTSPVKMGGAKGDFFDGKPLRCDASPDNFWAQNTTDLRSATVSLRKKDVNAKAGVSTGADCATPGPGTTSPTWWEYSEIYVR